MDRGLQIAWLKFRVAEVKELLKIKEKRIKEFEGKEQKLRKTGTEKKTSTRNLSTQIAFLPNTLQSVRTNTFLVFK